MRVEMDESALIQNRRHRRTNVLMKATLELPGDGARVLFHRDGLSVPSRIAWSHCGYAGVQFDYPLFPKEVLRHVPPPKHKVAAPIGRRPGLAAQPLTQAERQLIEQWGRATGRAI
jgi:hypothetical protein